MRSTWTSHAGAVLVVVGALSACTQATASVADAIAEQGVGAFAEGSWRCETLEDSDGHPNRPTIVAVEADGRFTYEVMGEHDGPQVGTWSVDGLQLELAIPWDDDGRNGFYRWVHDGDAIPPTHVRGRQLDSENEQALDVEISEDRVTIVQRDDHRPGGPSYDWQVVCTRESTDPGNSPFTPVSQPG